MLYASILILMLYVTISYFCNHRHIFAVFDVNHDGNIDFQELLLAIAATSKTGLDNELEFVFEM